MSRPWQEWRGFTPSYLAGITAGAWWRLLRENRFAVDPRYWPRAAFLTGASLANSALRRVEALKHGRSLDAVRVEHPPLFILGHWRSGTTLLHNLLSLDNERAAFPNTYQVMNPETFLASESIATRLLAGLLPTVRPSDAMRVGFGTPQEDEFAPCLMSLRSTYLSMAFPRRTEHYLRYLTFDDADEAELEEWKAAFLVFLRKLTYLHGRPLVLKSPPHTARIRILLSLFPDARFVHVHRHPYRVYQSMRHNAETTFPLWTLQRPAANARGGHIIRTYRLMFDAFFRDRPLVADNRFCELRFADLERDPVGQVRAIYERLGLGDFDRLRPRLVRYVDGIAAYRKNDLAEPAPALRRRLAKAWSRTFDAWGYAT